MERYHTFKCIFWRLCLILTVHLFIPIPDQKTWIFLFLLYKIGRLTSLKKKMLMIIESIPLILCTMKQAKKDNVPWPRSPSYSFLMRASTRTLRVGREGVYCPTNRDLNLGLPTSLCLSVACFVKTLHHNIKLVVLSWKLHSKLH